MTSVVPLPDDNGPPQLTPDESVPIVNDSVAATFDDDGASPTGKRNSSWKRSAIEWTLVIVGAVVVALAIKATSIQAFYIPSRSMVPTLEVGDRVLVNKWSYRLHDVNRGDIVVFERPDGETSNIKDLIKRVIALPGEEVTIQDNHVLINGKILDEPYLPPGTVTASVGSFPCPPSDPCKVPDGDVWFMGDNRTDSKDSRYFGPVPESKIVGRAFFRLWPFGRIASL
ncbi:MAG: signal peptidase I [Actinomycetes bacterium]